VPEGREEVLILRDGQLTVMLNALSAVWAPDEQLSVALTVMGKTPADAGVPDIVPVDAFSKRPAGSEPDTIL
jgi:hypothetical protein